MIYGHAIEWWHIVLVVLMVVCVSIGVGCMLVHFGLVILERWRVRNAVGRWRRDHGVL